MLFFISLHDSDIFVCYLVVPFPSGAVSNTLDIDLEPVKEYTSKMAHVKPRFSLEKARAKVASTRKSAYKRLVVWSTE